MGQMADSAASKGNPFPARGGAYPRNSHTGLQSCLPPTTPKDACAINVAFIAVDIAGKTRISCKQVYGMKVEGETPFHPEGGSLASTIESLWGCYVQPTIHAVPAASETGHPMYLIDKWPYRVGLSE